MQKKISPFPWSLLRDWHSANGRHELPWRQYFHLSEKDLGYHVWLSEILLQQTQVSRGIAYYERILARYPTIESLAQSSYEEFFEYYQWLGYYSRARNMLRTAKIITEEYAGIFPKDQKSLINLPGVGPYTASAILAFAYDENILSFDTNLSKIFARYYHGSRFAKLSKEELRYIESDFQKSGISGCTINAALMDYASMISFNSKAQFDWDRYILRDCAFYKTHGEREIEKEKKRVNFPIKDASIVVTLHKNHKIYYSWDKEAYTPFILPPAEGDIRHSVQEYFRNKYSLELSVRPVHAKYYENDLPFVSCNAQIQLGNSLFIEYQKENWIFVKNT